MVAEVIRLFRYYVAAIATANYRVLTVSLITFHAVENEMSG